MAYNSSNYNCNNHNNKDHDDYNDHDDYDDYKAFRDYKNTSDLVVNTYRLNHTNQTVQYVKDQIIKHCINFDKCEMTIWDAIKKLDQVVDESDPDLDLPQIIHAFQTAEGLRSAYPEIEWLPLIGLIHDLGKIISLKEYGGQPQWSTVGDIYPVGCKYSDKIIFNTFFKDNPDSQDPIFSSKYGIYMPNCGLSNVLFSFGHDEYMYQVLKNNKCKIPELGLNIIRYHSFYAWHRDNQYTYLMNKYDHEIQEWCHKFSQCDLYTKSDKNIPDINKLKPYYQKIITKYFPTEILRW